MCMHIDSCPFPPTQKKIATLGVGCGITKIALGILILLNTYNHLSLTCLNNIPSSGGYVFLGVGSLVFLASSYCLRSPPVTVTEETPKPSSTVKTEKVVLPKEEESTTVFTTDPICPLRDLEREAQTIRELADYQLELEQELPKSLVVFRGIHPPDDTFCIDSIFQNGFAPQGIFYHADKNPEKTESFMFDPKSGRNSWLVSTTLDLGTAAFYAAFQDGIKEHSGWIFLIHAPPQAIASGDLKAVSIFKYVEEEDATRKERHCEQEIAFTFIPPQYIIGACKIEDAQPSNPRFAVGLGSLNFSKTFRPNPAFSKKKPKSLLKSLSSLGMDTQSVKDLQEDHVVMKPGDGSPQYGNYKLLMGKD